MIDENDIQEALFQRIMTAGLVWPVIIPNIDVPEPKPIPRLDVYVDRNGGDDVSLNGGSQYSLGILRILAVSLKGTGQTVALDKCQEVAALFPKALRLNIPSAQVVITNPATVRAGFRNGAEWVIPIIANYRADKT